MLVVGYFCAQGILQMTFETPAASYTGLQPQIAAIAFEGSENTRPELLQSQLESRPGQGSTFTLVLPCPGY